MDIGEIVKVESIDGITKYGVGVIESVGNAYTGGALVKMPNGDRLDTGGYKIVPIKKDKKRKRSHMSKRIV